MILPTLDDPAWLASEVRRLRAVMMGLYETNMSRAKQLEDIDEWLGKEEDTTGGLAIEWQEELRAILQRERPELIGPREMVRASFHFRDQRRPDGYLDALPGDGFGFVTATQTKLAIQFDCAGVLACSDLPFDVLREVLGKEGLMVMRLDAVPVPDPPDTDAYGNYLAGIVAGQRERIVTLEDQVRRLRDSQREGFSNV